MEYGYSGRMIPTKPWNAVLTELREIANEVSGCKYNYVLVNKYRNGRDRIGLHKDDERTLDPYATITTMSFGGERTLKFVHDKARSRNGAMLRVRYDQEMAHGSVLLLKYPTNVHFSHYIPEENSDMCRVSLTWRVIIKPYQEIGRM